MKKNNLMVSTVAITLCFLVLTLSGFGQGRYASVYSRAQVDDFVRQLEQSSDEFRTDFRNEVNNSRLNSSTRRNYLRYAEEFENAVDRLRSRFNSNDSWWESRNEVQTMLNHSRSLNTTMNAASFRRRIERQWNRLRNDINKLADTYDLPGLNGGGWTGGGWNGGNNGGWNNGGATSRPPSWAQGTFYGTGPDGSQVTLTINSNGRATAMVNGSPTYGAYNRGILTMGYNTARLVRSGNGFRTVSTTNGETINYSRNSWNNDNRGRGWNNTGRGNPPSWAVGSFVGSNPANGQPIYMTVQRNGSVTVSIGGGQSYGSMNGSMLTMGGNTARIYRDGNGFRTVSTSDGQTIYYRRN